MRKITKKQAEKLIKSTYGTFFGVSFIKSDGTQRNMSCRLGVSKGVNGKGQPFKPADYGLLTVWDTAKRAHRMVNLKTLYKLNVDGKSYQVV